MPGVAGAAVRYLFEAIGLASPFIYAVLTYWFFSWLDRNASAQATRAISGWLRGQRYSRVDVGHAILAAFDQIYSWPLSHIKAFRRSVIVSSIVFIPYILLEFKLYVLLEPTKANAAFRLLASLWKTTLAFPMFWVAVVISDYVSLFVIRRCLTMGANRPILAILFSTVVGGLVIAFSFFIVDFIHVGISYQMGFVAFCFQCFVVYIPAAVIAMFLEPFGFILMIPAFLVHVWLPLYGIGALGARLLYLILRAIEWAQWFLRQGNRHPLRAIGAVAAGVVFAATALLKLV